MNEEEETCQDGDEHEHEECPAAARPTGKSGGGDVTVSKEAGTRAENGVVVLTKCVVYLSLMLIEKDYFSNYGDDDDDEHEKEESRSDWRLECVNDNVEFFVTHIIPHLSLALSAGAWWKPLLCFPSHILRLQVHRLHLHRGCHQHLRLAPGILVVGQKSLDHFLFVSPFFEIWLSLLFSLETHPLLSPSLWRPLLLLLAAAAAAAAAAASSAAA